MLKFPPAIHTRRCVAVKMRFRLSCPDACAIIVSLFFNISGRYNHGSGRLDSGAIFKGASFWRWRGCDSLRPMGSTDDAVGCVAGSPHYLHPMRKYGQYVLR
ncbi:uncharacterized protein CIMG_00648 [Coccidioides immitis RS]|uniref:Uncharacterized protein n=1 Tax=Coccidioides immitis (strain RS) TaxID=246410 RepID=J3KHF7_COCIM|nr:uncharacterized protein CIMG_00648 [Coccidioides immitis RS]EAS35294.3 hypothetical protein CIMG_00648 [Coccidioides immitis RS]